MLGFTATHEFLGAMFAREGGSPDGLGFSTAMETI
jgi:hypothetical protein